jgi:hypothetical integral membrane protein (TIGR02206 family)
MVAQPFLIFGISHIATLVFIIAIAFLLPASIKNRKFEDKIFIGKIVGFFAIFLELVKPFIWHYSMNFAWIELIPIHMCNLSTLFIGIFLLTKKRLFFEVSFFWGIGGGLNALLTPDIPNNFPDPHYILFFVGHGFLMVAIAYASISLKNRPTLNSVKNGIYFSLVSLPMIYIINELLGPEVNYWYLASKPEGESLFNLFPDPPMHIPALIIIGTILFFVIYSPYWLYDSFKKEYAE